MTTTDVLNRGFRYEYAQPIDDLLHRLMVIAFQAAGAARLTSSKRLAAAGRDLAPAIS